MKEEDKTEWYDLAFPAIAFATVLAVPLVWIMLHITYTGA